MNTINNSTYHTILKINDYKIVITFDSAFKTVLSGESSISKIGTIHSHSYHEMFITANQPLKLATHKQEMSFSNCVVIIPPNFKHYVFNSLDCYRISFSIISKNEKKYNDFFKMNPIKYNDISRFELDQKYMLYVKEINNNLKKTGAVRNIIIDSFLTLLFCSVFVFENENSNLTTIIQNNYEDVITKAFTDYYSDSDFNIDFLSKKLFLCKKQTERVIKKLFHTTFSSMLINKKLSVSLQFLQYTNLSIGEIIKNVNFSTESYYYIQFKKTYGLSPLQYRKKYFSQNT